jgi:hypothetical protein
MVILLRELIVPELLFRNNSRITLQCKGVIGGRGWLSAVSGVCRWVCGCGGGTLGVSGTDTEIPKTPCHLAN